jgi:hypothetical protein
MSLCRRRRPLVCSRWILPLSPSRLSKTDGRVSSTLQTVQVLCLTLPRLGRHELCQPGMLKKPILRNDISCAFQFWLNAMDNLRALTGEPPWIRVGANSEGKAPTSLRESGFSCGYRQSM